jgi:hypothetical protein
MRAKGGPINIYILKQLKAITQQQCYILACGKKGNSYEFY